MSTKKHKKEAVEFKHQIDERTWRSATEVVALILDHLKEIGVEDAASHHVNEEMLRFSVTGNGGEVDVHMSPYFRPIGPWNSLKTPYFEVEVYGSRKQTFSPECDCTRDENDNRIPLFVKAPNVRKIAEKIKRELLISCEERKRRNSLDEKRSKMVETAKSANKLAGADVVGVSRDGNYEVDFRRGLSAEDVARIAGAGIADLLAVRSKWEVE